MRNLFARWFPALAAAFLGVGAWAQSNVLPDIVELDRIVAVVNDDVIVQSELDNRMRTVLAQLRQAGVPPPPQQVLEKQVLDRLILDRLQLQLAKDNGIRVDDEMLNRSVAEIARQNNLSLREFRDILERDGYDFASFREEIRNELLKRQIQQRQVTNRIQVTDRDVDNFLATLEQQGGTETAYHLGHILISVPEGASPEQIGEARENAEDIVARLEAGADFDRTAVAESDGQQALQGGDLGWRKAAELPTIFEAVVPQMSEGQVSPVIRSPSGFHIIKLLGVRGEDRHVVSQTHARHILVKPNEVVSPADAQRRLSQLRSRILGGADFSELARANSEDPGSAMKGGDLGWLSPGDTIAEFERRMDELRIDEVSRPFETQFGWHIVQVLERRSRDSTDEFRHAKAAEQLRKRKTEEELQTWLRQIRDEAYVEYRLDEE